LRYTFRISSHYPQQESNNSAKTLEKLTIPGKRGTDSGTPGVEIDLKALAERLVNVAAEERISLLASLLFNKSPS
jgi:hypothetical protein